MKKAVKRKRRSYEKGNRPPEERLARLRRLVNDDEYLNNAVNILADKLAGELAV